MSTGSDLNPDLGKSLRVAQLWRFPVKSFAGDRHAALALTPRGLVGDRGWMVVNDRGQFVTQRQLPAMSRCHAAFEGDELVLSALGLDGEYRHCLRLSFTETGCRYPVTVWRDQCEAVDMGDVAADWLQARLGQPLRLCYLPENVQRPVDATYAGPGDEVGFADGFPLLICTQASLDVLSQHFGTALDPRRFRANIIIAGAEPFAERQWRRLRIDGIEVALVKPCSRCVIPTIDPATGERDVRVFELLRQHCRGDDGQVYFGQNGLHLSTGVLREGGVVEVIETR